MIAAFRTPARRIALAILLSVLVHAVILWLPYIYFPQASVRLPRQVEIGTKEDIATPMGRMPALYLRKMHDQGEDYFEIWLGLEYRLLPVRFRRMDGSGNMLEEFVISGIRAAEE